MNIQDHAYFCPECSSASVTFSVLAGGEASCSTCAWHGKVEDLVSYSFQHDLGSSQEVMSAFAADFRQFMAKYMAIPLGQLLIKWGFFPGKLNAKDLGHYIGVTANACVLALLKARSALEKERIKGNGN